MALLLLLLLLLLSTGHIKRLPQLMLFFLLQLETSEEFEQISTAEERESFKEKLDEVRIFFFFLFLTKSECL